MQTMLQNRFIFPYLSFLMGNANVSPKRRTTLLLGAVWAAAFGFYWVRFRGDIVTNMLTPRAHCKVEAAAAAAVTCSQNVFMFAVWIYFLIMFLIRFIWIYILASQPNGFWLTPQQLCHTTPSHNVNVLQSQNTAKKKKLFVNFLPVVAYRV